jgi:hypothetical protein
MKGSKYEAQMLEAAEKCVGKRESSAKEEAKGKESAVNKSGMFEI